MAEGDVYTPQQIASLVAEAGPGSAFPRGTRFRQEAPLDRFYVYWDLETWDDEPFAPGRSITRRFGAGVVVIEASGMTEAVMIANPEEELLMDVDFLIPSEDPGSMGHSPAWVDCTPLPLSARDEEAIGMGRCRFHVTLIAPATGEDYG